MILKNHILDKRVSISRVFKFVLNMTFILSSEVKIINFISGEGHIFQTKMIIFDVFSFV